MQTQYKGFTIFYQTEAEQDAYQVMINQHFQKLEVLALSPPMCTEPRIIDIPELAHMLGGISKPKAPRIIDLKELSALVASLG